MTMMTHLRTYKSKCFFDFNRSSVFFIGSDKIIYKLLFPFYNSLVCLRILEQPPEQTVYRRNLKPSPTVMFIGDERQILQSGESLVVVPVLVRCDNLQEVKDKLSGNGPLKISGGAAVAFKKLKIMITSHQLGETLFCLKFELRKVAPGANPDVDYQVIASAQTNPVGVVSHSTLMKPSM